MGKNLENYEESEWTTAYKQALYEELNKRGLSGLSLDEVPEELLRESDKAARECVGEELVDE